MSQRQRRVGEELRHVLSGILRPGTFRDPALHDADVTVTEVRVSPDLRSATAFVMPLAGVNADEIVSGLRRSAGFVKHRLARELPLRHAPSILFTLDAAFDQAGRVAALLARPEVARDLRPAGGSREDEDHG